MARRQVIQLAIGDEFLIRTPEATFLRVIDIHLPIQNLAWINRELVSKQLPEVIYCRFVVLAETEDQRQFILLVQLQALVIHLAVHMNGQVGQPDQRLVETNQPRIETLLVMDIHPAGKT